jgi:hypothetical protein
MHWLATTLWALVGCVTGLVCHELTHAAVARALRADIHRIRLRPPAPEVVFTAPTPGVRAWILASTVLVAPALLAGAALAALWAWPAPIAWLPIGLGVMYLPRSRADWAGARGLVAKSTQQD